MLNNRVLIVVNSVYQLFTAVHIRRTILEDRDVDLLLTCLLYTSPEAREQLMRIKGVGPKVAECALLYGMHRLDAFPLDVWMKRAMSTLFPGKTPEDFGPYAGIAQQYLFHYSRMHPQLFQ